MNSAFFRSLRWRLTLTYTLVTVAALLTAGLLGLALVPAGLQPQRLLAQVVTGLGNGWASTPPMIQALAQTPPDAPAAQAIFNQLPAWYLRPPLDRAVLASENPLPPTGLLALIVDREGRLVATLPPPADPGLIGQPLAALSPALASLAAAALAGKGSIDEGIPGSLRVTQPVLDNHGPAVLGAVVVIGGLDTLAQQSTLLMLGVLGAGLLLFTFITGLVGTLFGFLATRGLTRRLAELGRASTAWRRGDFSISVTDHSQDEIGRLADDLNYMAADLRQLFETRQALAAIEERNRIARDLHDSIKQQAFAIAAQVGAAQSLLERDPGAARAPLREAELLSNQLRQELTALVRELYASDLLKSGLIAALRELVTNWGRQNHQNVAFEAPAALDLPAPAAWALYRVAQEALSNIARHAGATQVRLDLRQAGQAAVLEIADDGRGFDPHTAPPGIGLRSMRERLAALGGSLTVASEPGRGTTLTARSGP